MGLQSQPPWFRGATGLPKVPSGFKIVLQHEATDGFVVQIVSANPIVSASDTLGEWMLSKGCAWCIIQRYSFRNPDPRKFFV